MTATVKSILTCSDSTERDRRNQWRIKAWSFSWMLLWVGAVLAIKKGWLPSGAPAIAAIAVTGLLGVGTVRAYGRFLKEADELRRKIELDALALAFGVGVVGGMTYWILGVAEIVAEVDALNVVLAMIFTHGISVMVGQWRYR